MDKQQNHTTTKLTKTKTIKNVKESLLVEKNDKKTTGNTPISISATTNTTSSSSSSSSLSNIENNKCQMKVDNHSHHKHHHHSNNNNNNSSSSNHRHNRSSNFFHQQNIENDNVNESLDDDDSGQITATISKAKSVNNSNSFEKNTDMFCLLLEMMKMSSVEDIAGKLCLMSQLPLLCQQMRDYGYVQMLVQMLHPNEIEGKDDDIETNQKPSKTLNIKTRRDLIKALNNIVTNTSQNKKELRLLKILEDLRAFVDILFIKVNKKLLEADAVDHPFNLIIELFKMSIDKELIELIVQLGGIYVIIDVLEADFKFHKESRSSNCHKTRLYSLRILVNLTHENPSMKSLLGSRKYFLSVLIELLQANAEDLVQAVANLLQNLSYNNNYISMQIMRDMQMVIYLTKVMMKVKKEWTLKAILAAIGNLTASSPPNKTDFCQVEGSLEFLVLSMSSLSSEGITIVGYGTILRNISSYIATQEKYREILRQHKIIPLLLDQLSSPSIDVVTNSCVVLVNLSACSTKDSIQDQLTMLESSAIKRLANLKNSKHSVIRDSALAVLKNLVSSDAHSLYASNNGNHTLPSSLSFSSFPIRKMKAIRNEISTLVDSKSSCSTNDNVTLNGSLCASLHDNESDEKSDRRVSRSNSHDCIGTTYRHPFSNKLTNQNRQQQPLNNKMSTSHDSYQPSQLHGEKKMMSHSATYSTLPARMRNNSGKIEAAGVTSDYDVRCGDARCLIGQSKQQSSSFVHDQNELEVDPEPTDYSKRYKEQSIDEFSARAAASTNSSAPNKIKNDQNKSEVGISEDCVKVYQTEGTPLVYSLAPSLSDLRDLEEQLLRVSDNDDSNEQKSKPTISSLSLQSSRNKQSLLNHSGNTSFDERKKTKMTSSIETNRSLVASNKPELPPKPSPNKLNENNSNSEVKITENKQITSTSSYFTSDSAIEYATEDTPAIFSHATSLSSLTVEEEEDNQEEIDNESKQQNTNENEPTSFQEVDSYPKSSVVGDDSKKNIEAVNLKPKEVSVENQVEQQNESRTTVHQKEFLAKQSSQIQATSTNLPNRVDSSSNINIHDLEKFEQSDEDDDDQILQKCIECALPSQKKTAQVSSSNMPPKTPTPTDSENINKRLSGDGQSKSPVAGVRPIDNVANVGKSPRVHKNLYAQKSDSVVGDQKTKFFVEDTPVHFSECHSSLSSLSFDSNDEAEDNQLLEAAINLGINCNVGTGSTINSTVNGANRSTSASSRRHGESLVSKTTTTAATINQGQNTSSNITPSAHRTVTKSSSNIDSSNTMTTTTVATTNQTNGQHSHKPMDDDLDDMDDEKTYVVCTTASRQSSATIPSSSSLVQDISSSSGISSCTTETLVVPVAMQSRFVANKNHSHHHDHQRSSAHMAPGRSKKAANSSGNEVQQRKNFAASPNYKNNINQSSNKKFSKPQPMERKCNFNAKSEQKSSAIKIDQNQQRPHSTETDIPSQSLSFEECSYQSLIENTKPPSIIDHSSLMSQSTASIDSKISDIAFDQVPIRTANSQDLVVAAAASSCAKEINSLVKSCIDLPQHQRSRCDSENCDKTKSELLSYLTANRSSQQKHKNSKETISYGHQLEKLEDLERETRYHPPISNMNYSSHEEPLMFEDFAQNIEQQHQSNRQLFYPFGSNFASQPLHHRHYDEKGSPIGKTKNFLNSKADFEDKDLVFTSKHRDMVMANHALYFQNKSQQVKTASKYFDRHPLPCDVPVGVNNISTRNQVFFDDLIRLNDEEKSFHSNKTSNSGQGSGSSSYNKSKESRSLLSNVKSKLTSSFSSHNIGQNATNSTLSSASKSASKKIEIKSKIVSFWKRSRSTHDKLDSSPLDSQILSSPTSSPKNFTINRTASINEKAKLDMSRTVSARRSFSNKESVPSTMTRSSTYEKLPLSNEEALACCDNRPQPTKEFESKKLLSHSIVGHSSGMYYQDEISHRLNNNIPQFGSLNTRKNRANKNFSLNNNNFTFMTFVKSLNNNNNNLKSNAENNNNNNDKNSQFHKDSDSFNNDSNNNKSNSESEKHSKALKDHHKKPTPAVRKMTPSIDRKTLNPHREKSQDNGTGEGGSSSCGQNRKTCLVTTV